jgi:hypothetical protein
MPRANAAGERCVQGQAREGISAPRTMLMDWFSYRAPGWASDWLAQISEARATNRPSALAKLPVIVRSPARAGRCGLTSVARKVAVDSSRETLRSC